MVDLYHSIYNSEVFATSNCIWHENTFVDFVRSQLQSLGYHSVSDNNKTWRRGNRTVVICVVDDFATCKTDHTASIPYAFDANTVVITDNWISVPTQYTVYRLPQSFFGIYSHRPQLNTWKPDRRFNFSVNRLDTKRMLLMLEIWHRCRLTPQADQLDYINFNCWSWNGDNGSKAGLINNFTQQWHSLESQYQTLYQPCFDYLSQQMPWRNHSLDHEQQHVSAWINVVAETYSSDTTVALSEKIFRALCLPVPWIVYAGKHTVALLTSLGFDVLSDLVSHQYDSLIENRTAAYGDKLVDFVYAGAHTVDKIKQQQFDTIQQRCHRAATHNQTVLSNMRQQWPLDLAAWWPKVVQSIA
jgi:hypothetical protein